MFNCKVLASITLLCLLTPSLEVAADSWLSDLEKQLENKRLQRLHQVQLSKPQQLAEFTSDGCSGGLSAGWSMLAEAIPNIEATLGKQPLWEHCCVEHDKYYWRGETQDGFAQRIKADQALRHCVVMTGKQHSHALSKQLSMPSTQIETLFQLAGDLMYEAVRLGGKPCTPLPWRWGYGWPACPLLTTQP